MKKMKLKRSSSRGRQAFHFSRVALVQEPSLLGRREGTSMKRSSEEGQRRDRRRHPRSQEQQGQEVDRVCGEEAITQHSSAGVHRNISLNLQRSVWSSTKAIKKKKPLHIFFFVLIFQTKLSLSRRSSLKKGGFTDEMKSLTLRILMQQ